MKNLLIYDLPDNDISTFFDLLQEKEFSLLNANEPTAKCTGCFKCWLKHPGFCTFQDKIQWIGKEFINCDEVIIICQSLYGGFSVNVKRIIDRVIPGVLPFFTKKNNELHHLQRYKRNPRLKVIFYNSDNMSNDEKEQAKNLISAVGLNFHSENQQVIFVNNIKEIFMGVIK